MGIMSGCGDKYTNDNLLKMVNGYDVSLFIITADNEYVLCDEYDETSGGNGLFVHMTSDALNPEYGDDNSVTIYKDWKDAIVEASAYFPRLKKPIISMDKDGYVCAIWQADNEKIPDNEGSGDYEFIKYDKMGVLSAYLDGYRSCQNIMSNVSPLLKRKTRERYIPAIMLAHHTCVHFNGKNYNGYLPAIG